MSETTVNDNVKVYPNPAYDELIIKTESANYSSFTITNQLGQVVLQSALKPMQTDIGISQLASGLYYIVIKGNNNEIKTMRFVKM